MRVPYSRYISFLVNGINRSYRANLDNVRENLEFGFEEYVTSQMHMPMYPHSRGRDVFVLDRVYCWLTENADVGAGDVSSVLRWFYQDMAKFFHNISYCEVLKGLALSLDTPTSVLSDLGLPVEDIDFETEKAIILETITNGCSSYEAYINLQYRDLVLFETTFASDEQKNRYVTSVILEKNAALGNVIRW
ncbi:hypothetical protein AGMMS49975_10030 [Clostridia bacterium]|nr:hypothetical protein AGMMS49975_10030 [Clostridia bacterium]